MKYYRKKQKKTDPVQRLGPGREYFEFMLNPQSEMARQDEEQAREQQLANEQTESLYDDAEFDESAIPRHPDDVKVDHKGFVQALVVLVLLILLLVGVAVLK